MQVRRSQSSTSIYHDTYLQKLSNLVKVNKNTYRKPYEQCQRSHSNLRSKEQKKEKPLPIPQHVALDDNTENNTVQETINTKPTSIQYNNQYREENSNQNKSVGVLNRISRSTSFSSQHSDAIAFHYYNERRRHRMHLKQMRANKYITHASNGSECNALNDKYKGVYDMYGVKRANQNNACDNKQDKKINNCNTDHVLHTEIRAIRRQKQRENASHENVSNVNDLHNNHTHVSLPLQPRRMSRHEQFMLYKVVNTNANVSHPDINTSSDVNNTHVNIDNECNNNKSNASCNSIVNVNDPLFMREKVFAEMPESDRYLCLLMANLLLRCNRLESQEILQSLMRCVERKRLLRQYVSTYTTHSAKADNNDVHTQNENINNIDNDNVSVSNKSAEVVCEGSNAEINSLYSLHSPCAIAGKESLIRVLQSKQRSCKSEPTRNEAQDEQKCEQYKQNEEEEQQQEQQEKQQQQVQLINMEHKNRVNDNACAHVNSQEESSTLNNIPEEIQTENGRETTLELENAEQYNYREQEKVNEQVKCNQEIVEHVSLNEKSNSNLTYNVAENDVNNSDSHVTKPNINDEEDDKNNGDEFNGTKSTQLQFCKRNKQHEKESRNSNQEQGHKWKETQRPHPLSVNNFDNAMTNSQVEDERKEEHHEVESPVSATPSSSSSSSSLQQPEIHHVEQIEYISQFYPTPEMLVELDERELSPGAAAARQAYLQAHPELLQLSSSHVHTSESDESTEEEEEEENEKLEELLDSLEQVEEEEQLVCENDDDNIGEEEFERPQRRYGELVSQNRRLGSGDIYKNFHDNQEVLNNSHEGVNAENANNNVGERYDIIENRVNHVSYLDNDVDDDNDNVVCSNCISFSSSSKSKESSDNRNSQHQSESEDETNMETLSQREQYDFTLPAANSVHIPFVQSNDNIDSGNDNSDNNDDKKSSSQSIKSVSEEEMSDIDQVNIENDHVFTADTEEDVLLPWEEEELKV